MITAQKLASTGLWRIVREGILKGKNCQKCQKETPDILRRKSVTSTIIENKFKTTDEALQNIDLFFDEYILICRSCQFDLIKQIVEDELKSPASPLSEILDSFEGKDMF